MQKAYGVEQAEGIALALCLHRSPADFSRVQCNGAVAGTGPAGGTGHCSAASTCAAGERVTASKGATDSGPASSARGACSAAANSGVSGPLGITRRVTVDKGGRGTNNSQQAHSAKTHLSIV